MCNRTCLPRELAFQVDFGPSLIELGASFRCIFTLLLQKRRFRNLLRFFLMIILILIFDLN
jgi:hypothetical protein